MANLQKKTPLLKGRNKESCERSGRIVRIPVIVEPVVVPVPLPAIKVQIEDVAVAIRIAQICKTPPITTAL
jgi:hypothetical protein